MAATASAEQRAHANLCDFTRFMARLQPEAQLLDRDGILAVKGPVDFPSDRIAMRATDEGDAQSFVDAVDGFFRADSGRSVTVFIRDGLDDDVAVLLQQRGYNEFGSSPQMICDRRPPDRAPAAPATVRLASTANDIHAYADIAAEAFTHLSFDADATRNSVRNADVMLGDEVIVSIAEIDGRRVAGACCVLVGDEPNGYVAWVACADEARGHGLGDTVTRLVTNSAFDRGAHIVSLEASHFGASTYARMGYREIRRYRVLVAL